MSKKKDNLIILSLLIGIVVLILPYAYTILHAVPSSDDFVMAVGVDKNHLFSEAVRVANHYYLNWGGIWIASFLEVFLNPLLRFGTVSIMYGVEMLCFFFLFVLVLLWMVRNIFVYVLKIKDWKVVLGTYIVILLAILNISIWTEIFYWFVGSCYLWGMLFGMSAIALLVKFYEKDSIVLGVLIAVLGFPACAFYMEAILPMMVYFLLVCYEFFKTRKVLWKKLIPFVFWCAGFISALIAPGNFVRHDATAGSGGLNLFKAAADALIIWFDSLFDLVKNPLMLIVMCIFVLIGAFILKEKNFRFQYPVIPFLLALMCLYIVYYPIALGYGSSRYLPNRVQFIFKTYAVLMFAAACIYFGGWCSKKYGEYFTTAAIRKVALFLIVFGYVCIIPTKYYEELPYAQTVAQHQNVKMVSSEWKYLLNYIEMVEEEDVFLSRSKINTVIIKEPGISVDKDYEVNRTFAEYYGKKSIVLEMW